MLQIARPLALVMLVFGAFAAAPASALAEEPDATGVWQQVDPDTKRVGAYVQIRQVDGLYEGVFTKLFLKPTDPPNPICDGCKGDQKGHPFLGLKLMYNLTRHGLTYDGGTIVDPRDGSEYSVELTLAPDNQTLTVRGYIGLTLFGQSQEWKRLNNADKELKPVKDTKPLKGSKDLKPKDPKTPDHKPTATE